MPVNSTHPKYSTKKSEITEDAYKGSVLDYVPRLTKQSSEQYNAYVQRGVYFNVTKRTVEAMVGAILRKPFTTDVEVVMIDGGMTLDEYVSELLRGITICGRTGILVDYDNDENSPYLTTYKNEHIINWRDDHSMVVLHEDVYVPSKKDPYELEEIEQYRELFIDPETGYYTVRLWQAPHSTSSKAVPVLIDTFVPTRRGEPLTYIPFIFVNPFDTSTKCYEPVAYNLAQLNISHFKTVVDLEHAAHFTALPTPWIAGDLAQDTAGAVALGGDHFIQLEQGAQIGFLEFTGAGLNALEKRLESKEMQMAVIGSNLLTFKSGVESADALHIRSASETATMNNIVNAVESAMQQALTIYKWWAGSGEEQEAQFEMSRDFTASSLSPQEMIALMQLYMNGTISQETYLENLFEGEITQDVEEEIRRLSLNQGGQTQ